MSSMLLTLSRKMNLDKVGISASLLCAIHCALMPFLLPVAAMLGFSFLWSPGFEALMLLLALAVGLYSLTIGYRHSHRNSLPFLFLAGGIAVILLSKLLFPEDWEFVVLPIGALLIVASHGLNWWLISRFTHDRTCPVHHHHA